MKRGWIIWSDNGVKGQYGATQYTDDELAREGAIHLFVARLERSGVTVYHLDRIVLDEPEEEE